MPHDPDARKTDKGDFICGVCNREQRRKIVDGMSKRWKVRLVTYTGVLQYSAMQGLNG
jgi:hypothetical protein